MNPEKILIQKTRGSDKVSFYTFVWSTYHSFILVFCPQPSRLQFCTLGHIPNLVKHTGPSLLPDWFSHGPRPLPATTATQLSPVSFIVGMRTGLLHLRIEWWERFAGSGRGRRQTSDRMNSWLGKHLNYMGMWHMCVGDYRVLFMGVTASTERGTGSHCIGKALCLSHINKQQPQ